MGQTLSEPIVEKGSQDGHNDVVLYGVSCMQGWRIGMEDAHACVLDLLSARADDDQGSPLLQSQLPLSFFGVYDGHGGDRVAQYAGDHVHQILAKQDAFTQGDMKRALQDAFLATDRAILSDARYEDEVSGCTASVGVITKTAIFVANSGDSRTVLGIKGRAKPLSFDHKPQNEGEKLRIQAAGGYVDFGRVNGNLALSRAIGDFEFKKHAELPPEHQVVTAFPDVQMHQLSDDDEFLVVACDGIWDCQSSQAVVEFVRRGIVAKQELSSICENMMDNCLASNSDGGGVGCDNMTMIIVGLLGGRTKEQWYHDIAMRVANGDGPCAPPEYAEFRGPGVHHPVEESSDEMDLEGAGRFRPNAGGNGRVILLTDGTDLPTESGDSEMFDDDDEDEDLDAQVDKFTETALNETNHRHVREGTPGPTHDEAAESKSPPPTEPATPQTAAPAPGANAQAESAKMPPPEGTPAKGDDK